jgi:hypothetical protein
MKKILFFISLIFLSITPLQALEEEFKPIILEPQERAIEEKVSPYTRQALKGIIEKEYDLNSSTGMFKEQLTFQFNRGIIKNTTIHSHMIHTLGETITNDDKDFNYDTSLINVGLSGKFRSDKEKYTLLFDLTPDIFEDFSHRFLLDAHIETTRIKNHTILFGSSRPQVGYEGGNSAKTIPLLTRTQAGRNFSNARKTGIKIDGKHKWVDYEIGGFSSDVRYHEFFPGIEGSLWVDFKPFANIEEKYGKLYVSGGISHGERNSTEFTVASSAIRYNKEKFWARAEYQHADGSNGGSGLTDKKGYGYNLTLGYRLTKKLELIARYDDLDKDKSIKNNNSREYTAGLNWYILGQTARVMLNYIFCENESKQDSHRILLGTQIIL